MEHLRDLKFKDNWDSITIADFIAIHMITDNTRLTPMVKTLKILALLAGITYEQLKAYHCPISEFWQINQRLDFLKTPPDAPLKEFYTIGGKVYKLIGNIADLNTGQFMDSDDSVKVEIDIVNNLPSVCAAFLLPVIEKTEKQLELEKDGLQKFPSVEKYMETPISATRANLYQNMLYQDANAICLFFCLVGQLYTAITKDFLKVEIQEKITSALTTLNQTRPANDNQARMINRLRERIISMGSGVGLAV
jgi:hypothetical protein